jgi:hypothetical protein
MKNKKQMFRQGDVLIERVSRVPAAVQPQPASRVILAHGEVTGHAHELARPAVGRISSEVPAGDFRVAGDLDDQRGLNCMALVVGESTEVVHQEHAPIPLEAEEYRVTRQREYSPEAIRNVAD